MSYIIIGNKEEFAIAIKKEIKTPSGPYGGVFLYINGHQLGDPNDVSFINQTLKNLMLFPSADDLIMKYNIHIDAKLELWNFFFNNSSNERLKYISGFGESFDQFLTAHFEFNNEIYFFWQKFKPGIKKVKPGKMHLEKVEKQLYFSVVKEAEKLIYDWLSA